MIHIVVGDALVLRPNERMPSMGFVLFYVILLFGGVAVGSIWMAVGFWLGVIDFGHYDTVSSLGWGVLLIGAGAVIAWAGVCEVAQKRFEHEAQTTFDHEGLSGTSESHRNRIIQFWLRADRWDYRQIAWSEVSGLAVAHVPAQGQATGFYVVTVALSDGRSVDTAGRSPNQADADTMLSNVRAVRSRSAL